MIGVSCIPLCVGGGIPSLHEQHKDFPTSARVGSALLMLGQVQVALGNKVDARAAFKEALTQLESAVGADTPQAQQARRFLTEI